MVVGTIHTIWSSGYLLAKANLRLEQHNTEWLVRYPSTSLRLENLCHASTQQRRFSSSQSGFVRWLSAQGVNDRFQAGWVDNHIDGWEPHSTQIHESRGRLYRSRTAVAHGQRSATLAGGYFLQIRISIDIIIDICKTRPVGLLTSRRQLI